MGISLNMILREAGLNLGEVRLLRHKDKRATKGRTPYELWRDNKQQFNLYQSTQSFENRGKLSAQHWVSFVVTPADETMFVGLYRANYRGLLECDTPQPHAEGMDKAGSCDVYDLELQDNLSDLIGILIVDWGPGGRAWIQRADRQNKGIIELRREFKEPEFPGFLNFLESLSMLERLPKGWIVALSCTKGVYILTCPKTKEQYIGSATGADGFYQRWQEYAQTGHGGDVALKSRESSDYQVSILEVAGTSATDDDIRAMETRWKLKLQSREMGLNRN
ncbi:MAG: GIY-YIG nuclease family protein [Desulfurivibrio sp.]|nr:MAG: GIY-YIG nuclease family protein [Desulfurivibrio sp.]